MDAGLRLFLLLVGVFIIVGLIWDFRRNRGQKKDYKTEESKGKKALGSRRDRVLDDLEDDFLIDEGVSTVTHRMEPQREAPVLEGEVIVLQIMAKHPHLFSGKKLLDALNQAHLSYGEMQIFHRHQNIDGTGAVVFSLASAIEPGYFEISKIETYQTPGLTLFFTTTRPNQSVAAFELMLRTAKQLAERLDADLKDDKHRPLTIQAIEAYRDRIRTHRVLRGSARAS